MAYSEQLAARIRSSLSRRKNIVEKKMFGGLIFLLNGNMLVGIWRDSLIVRLGSKNKVEAMLAPHVQEFDITGRPMRDWVLVQPAGLEGDEPLGDWIQRAMEFVKKLPPKSK